MARQVGHQEKSSEIIYSQHTWLCTSPAYDTVHMRSFVVDIRLHKNGGHLSCSHTDDGLRPSGDQIFSLDCMTWYNCTARCYLTTWTKSTVLPYSSSCKHKCYTPGAGETKTKQKNSHFFVLTVFFKQIRGCGWTTDNKMRLSDVIFFFSVHTWPLTSKKQEVTLTKNKMIPRSFPHLTHALY